MESRREFLTHSAGLIASLSMVPGLRLPDHREDPSAIRLAVRNEIPRLIFELHIFRVGFLPILLSPPISDVPANARGLRRGPSTDRRAELNHWQQAANDLMHALPSMNSRVPNSTSLEAFADFHTTHALCYKDLLDPPPDPCYELGTDWPPIRWRIDLEMNGWRDAVARGILSEICGRDDDLPDPCVELARCLPRVRQMVRECSADFNRLVGIYDFWLPVLADIDPSFAVDALDYERLKSSLVRGRPAFNTGGQFLTDAFTTGVAFTALNLANNHFPKIGRLLEEPGIGGYWATMIPSLVSAVLYHKVVALRKLARSG